jgi:hypothetical protein
MVETAAYNPVSDEKNPRFIDMVEAVMDDT